MAVLIIAMGTGPAFAYVDPGSASIIVTAILGGIAAVGFYIRTIIFRVRSFFTSREADSKGDTPDQRQDR